MPNIKFVGTPNQSSRNGRKPIAIIDHITAGSYPGCLEWLCNSASQASAHFLINKAGEIFQLVDMGNKAWHAGNVANPSWSLYDGTNPNLYTIGIEHEGRPGDALTEAQYQSSLWLHKFIMNQYPVITPDNEHIIGHYRIDSVNRPDCPGSGFPWARLFNDLNKKGETNVPNHVIAFWSAKDYSAAVQISERLGNCLMTCRNAKPDLNPDAKAAKHLIVVGGPEVKDHPNVTNLCGQTGPDTAILAASYAKGL
ncbi:MAG: N-acetylmuramoyl-L-alanine amidase [Clostridiales bacterium]|nr:N-acetylmuramoyl-L-alanine amidase [Clostridiales bacterium]